MIASKKRALTAEQCAGVVEAARQIEFKRAAVRNTDGSSSYNDNHRESMVSFLKPADLPTDTWLAIHSAVVDMNQQHYKANIDQFDMQVAEYSAGQTGFDWHNDDPPYPSDELLWSGRKLTCVIELSDPSSYNGGYLQIQPYRALKQDSDMFGKSQEMIAAALQKLNATHMLVDGNKIEIFISDQAPRSVAHTSTVTTPSSSNREQGEATMFPSFFYHKVYPMLEGKRYSLTVWARGPLWV